MKNILLASVICFVLTLATYAQSKPMATPPKVIGRQQCIVPFESAPVIRGLKLGMSENDVVDLLGENLTFEFDAKTWTRKATHIFISSNKPREFSDVSYIVLESYNGNIFQFSINYSNDVEWNSVREFVENFAPKLGLPLQGWEFDYIGASLTCQDFVTRLMAHRNGSVELTDLRAVRQIAADMRKTDAERKKAMRP